MTIYEIDNAIIDAYEKAIDPETGEVLDEALLASLEQLQMERETKCENIACWIKDLLGDAEKIKAEAKNLSARAKAAENKAERLKAYLEWALDGQKLKTARCSVSYRTSKAVEIDPEALAFMPERFLRFKDPEPDKKAIGDAIKAGEQIAGCRLVENVSMIIK